METSVNNKCKAFTSLNQSKKLAEILPLETADMYYDDIIDMVTGELFIPNDGSTIKVGKGLSGSIAAWSLAALLGVLPFPLISQNINKSWDCEVFSDDDSFSPTYIIEEKDNPVDACYEMILKLHEQKLL